MTIRSLKPGEAVPAGEPRRYPNSNGYMRLRWKVGVGQYVEAYEHRIFDGRVTEAVHVHHVNHNRTDNRPENLRPVTREEHHKEHASILPPICTDLYMSGWNRVEIAEDLGINAGTVSRALAKAGVKTRPSNLRRLVHVDRSRVQQLYDEGYATDLIATVMGVERGVLRRHMREMGLPPRPFGYKAPRHLRALVPVDGVERAG